MKTTTLGLKSFSLFVLISVSILFSLLVPISTAYADVWVNGYTRSNGTYVSGHYRSSPDGNPYNNYSYPGNTNPYTGKVAPGNSNTYLKNYYSSPSSGSSYSSYKYVSPTPSYSGYSSQSSNVPGGYMIGNSVFCNSGYYQVANSCKKAPSNSTAYGGYSFYCNSGYNKVGDSCQAPKNGSYIGYSLSCDDGYRLDSKGDKCISEVQYCRAEYGKGTSYNKTTSECVCSKGYFFNDDSGKCETHKTICKAVYGRYSIPVDKDSCSCKEGYDFNSKNKCVAND